MNLQPSLSFAQSLFQKVLQPGDIAVDATVGNGHDTAFLAKMVGETGHVFGFDIQPEAINQTNKRLQMEELSNQVSLFHRGHEHATNMIPPHIHGAIKGVIFNLGYLPRGNKMIITKPETTISAVEQLLTMMAQGGLLILVVYHGHEGGAEERDALLQYVANLEQQKYNVLQYSFINQINHPPFLLAIEKKLP